MSYHRMVAELQSDGLGDPDVDDGPSWEYYLEDLDRDAAAMDAAREEQLNTNREEDDT